MCGYFRWESETLESLESHWVQYIYSRGVTQTDRNEPIAWRPDGCIDFNGRRRSCGMQIP